MQVYLYISKYTCICCHWKLYLKWRCYMIERGLYLDKIDDYIDDPMVKIIKGIRRCGKTEILKMIQGRLLNHGISEKQIVYINFESFMSRQYLDFIELYKYIKKCYEEVNDKIYIFLDEIQEVEFWEKTVRSLRIDIPCDIYLTGSNANMLSGDLATLLSGRYVEIEVLPLSFTEFELFYKDIFSSMNRRELFERYIRFGGFPDLINIKQKDEVLYNYLSSIYNTVVLRDVVERGNIRNPELLRRILTYIMDNIGQMTSGAKILNYLKGANREKISTTSLYNYIDGLENAMIVYSAKPYDIKGKKVLKRSEKFYLADLGLRHTVLGYRENDIGQLLENIVYLELRRRGYEVYVGKVDEYEIDFVAKKGREIQYYQVAYSIMDEVTANREYRSLEMIADNYDKFVITMDELQLQGRNGIKWLSIQEFLKTK